MKRILLSIMLLAGCASAWAQMPDKGYAPMGDTTKTQLWMDAADLYGQMAKIGHRVGAKDSLLIRQYGLNKGFSRQGGNGGRRVCHNRKNYRRYMVTLRVEARSKQQEEALRRYAVEMAVLREGPVYEYIIKMPVDDLVKFVDKGIARKVSLAPQMTTHEK